MRGSRAEAEIGSRVRCDCSWAIGRESPVIGLELLVSGAISEAVYERILVIHDGWGYVTLSAWASWKVRGQEETCRGGRIRVKLGNDEVFLVPYGQEQNKLVEWKIATYSEMVIYGYALFGWEGPTILGEIFNVCSIYTKSLAHWCPTMPGMTKNPMFPTCIFFFSIIPQVGGGG
jgi:hypothetical protein